MTLPLNNLYRRPAELVPATAAFAAAAAYAWFGTGAAGPLALPAGVQALLVAGLGGAGLWRWRQGWRLLRFQAGLRNLPYYALRGRDLPVSRSVLILGRGFHWTPEHTQRMALLQLPTHAKLARPSRWHDRWRRLERRVERGELGWLRTLTRSPDLGWLTRLTRHPGHWNPGRPLPPVEGSPALHGVGMWEGEDEVTLDLGARVGHAGVIGTTRVGKSRLLEFLVTQDIRRGGNCVIVIDPKGDADCMRRVIAEARRVGRPLYVFHLGFPEISARYSPIGDYERITETAGRIAGQLPGEGQSRTFREFVWRYINVIAKTLQQLGIKPSYQIVYRHAANVDGLVARYLESLLDRLPEHASVWRQEVDGMKVNPQELDKAMKTRSGDAVKRALYCQKHGIQDDIAAALMAVMSNEKSYFDKLVASLFPLLEKLCTGKVAELISPDYDNVDDLRPIFTWDDVMNRDAVVYVGLDALTDREVARAVGNAMLSDLKSIAGRRYNRGAGAGLPTALAKQPVILHIDEVNEVMGDEAVPMLNKAGGAEFQVTYYTQSLADLAVAFGGDTDKAQQALDNTGTLVMFRVQSTDTAELLTARLREVQIPVVTPESRVTDTNDPTQFGDFASSNSDRLSWEAAPLLSPTEVLELPKGQAFVLKGGNQLYKLRVPLPVPEPDAALPADLAGVAQAMERIYQERYLSRLAPSDADYHRMQAAGGPAPESAVTIKGVGSGF